MKLEVCIEGLKDRSGRRLKKGQIVERHMFTMSDKSLQGRFSMGWLKPIVNDPPEPTPELMVSPIAPAADATEGNMAEETVAIADLFVEAEEELGASSPAPGHGPVREEADTTEQTTILEQDPEGDILVREEIQEEDTQGQGEPRRDGLGIEDYWASADRAGAKSKACPHCDTAHRSKTSLFSCCKSQSTWENID